MSTFSNRMALFVKFRLPLSLELFEFLYPCLMVHLDDLIWLSFLQNSLVFLHKIVLWADKHEVLLVELNLLLALDAILFVAEVDVVAFGLFKGWEFGHFVLIVSFEDLFNFLGPHRLSFFHLLLNSNLVADLSFGHLVLLPLLEVLNFVGFGLLSSVIDFSVDPALIFFL